MSLSPQRAANLAENPHAGQGAVVLDIGDGVGAIIAHLTAADEGAEIEIEALEVEATLPDHTHEPSPDTSGAPAQDHDHDHHDHPHTHPHRPHVAVVGRPTPSGGVLYSAVFPSVPVGTYRLHEPDSGLTRDVVVTEATVTEVDWSA